MEKRAVNRPVSDLPRTAGPEVLDVISNHVSNDGKVPSIANGTANGHTHADRVKEAIGGMFMDVMCSHCGSEKVIRAGACGVCTECGTSQGCS